MTDNSFINPVWNRLIQVPDAQTSVTWSPSRIPYPTPVDPTIVKCKHCRLITELCDCDSIEQLIPVEGDEQAQPDSGVQLTANKPGNTKSPEQEEEEFDKLMQRAAVPNLATIFRQGVKTGVLSSAEVSFYK